MARPGASVARTVVVAGLILQFVLTVLQILQAYPASTWIRRAAAGESEPVMGTLALLLLLALAVPAARGRAWALVLATGLQVLLTLGMLPWLIRKFTRPEEYVQWFLNLSYVMVGVTAVLFGGIAVLEVLGRLRPAPWRPGAGVSGQAALVLVVISALAGLSIAGAGAARRPLATGSVAGVPEEVVMVSLDLMSFTPTRLELPAGRRVALLLANRAMDEHSFDLDAQNIHVRVPGRSTAIAMVQVPTSGQLPFYCGVPGHTPAGMTGVIVPR